MYELGLWKITRLNSENKKRGQLSLTTKKEKRKEKKGMRKKSKKEKIQQGRKTQENRAGITKENRIRKKLPETRDLPGEPYDAQVSRTVREETVV